MQCSNHLKQLALAQHNHADVYGCFSQASRPQQLQTCHNDADRFTSYIVSTLPFLEQGALYEQAVACIRDAPGWGQLISASSSHTAGVNVAMCDGAVRFVTDSVDAGNQSYDPWDGVLQRGGQWGDNPGSQALHSRHSGGMSFSDFSARYGGRVTDPSGYGIWGAMGSRQGGDSGSL